MKRSSPKKLKENLNEPSTSQRECSLSFKLSTKGIQVEKNKITIEPEEVELKTIPKGEHKTESAKNSVSSSLSAIHGLPSQTTGVLLQNGLSVKGGHKPVSETDIPSQLWVDKYKPMATKGIIGQQGDKSNLRKLQAWLKEWNKYNGACVSGKRPSRPSPWAVARDDGAWAKAVLLSGPPGVGKTTTSYLVAKELGYEVMEMNASDTRSKKQLDSEVSDAVNTKSVADSTAKRLVNNNYRQYSNTRSI